MWGKVLVARKLPDGLRILFFLFFGCGVCPVAMTALGIITLWGGMGGWFGRVVWQMFVRCGCWFCLSFRYEINEPRAADRQLVSASRVFFSLWIL